MRQIYTPRAPLPGTNGERILAHCRDRDGSFLTVQERDRITCRQLNADGYLVRDRRNGELWYWTELGRDILELMYRRRSRAEVSVPPLEPLPVERQVWQGVDGHGKPYTLVDGILPFPVIADPEPVAEQTALKRLVPYAGKDVNEPIARVFR